MRTPVPIKVVEARAIADFAATKPAAGLGELLICHDEWCLSQRPPGTWCNCEPEVVHRHFGDDVDLASKRFREINESERNRRGLNQSRDN